MPGIVYFGGTFDPVHRGHVAMATAAVAVPDVERVVFLPAPIPPHKRDQQLLSFDRRVRLLNLVCRGNPAFVVSTLENELPVPSFTARTLAALVERGETVPISLLIGADTLLDLPNWWHPEEVVRLASFLVAPRAEVSLQQVRRALQDLIPVEQLDQRVQYLDMPLVECSSTRIRAALIGGLDPGEDVPEPVRAYLRRQRSDPAPPD
ncbi:MAG: nicotinate (nicotinamide) nucleotide adenylyltransferase [Nitrospirota bacterium]